MTSLIYFGQIMGKYAGLSTAEKNGTCLYSEPSELCVHNFWAPLYFPLSPPPLCFSGPVNSRWKKDYLCSDKKERKKINQKAEA